MPDPCTWLAEAAMLRIMRRTLPAQRHEVLGALSALKLQLAVARRRAGREAGAAGPADDRLAQLDAMAEQQLAAQTALTDMRLWDGLAVQRRALDAVLAQCIGWSRQSAAMRGHRLDDAQLVPELAPADEAARGMPMVQVPAAHQLMLGWLFHTIDALAEPATLQPRLAWQPTGWTLQLHCQAREDAALPLALPPGLPEPAGRPSAVAAGQTPPDIDRAMLEALARHVGSEDGTWHCGGWADAAPPPPPWLRYQPA